MSLQQRSVASWKKEIIDLKSRLDLLTQSFNVLRRERDTLEAIIKKRDTKVESLNVEIKWLKKEIDEQ